LETNHFPNVALKMMDERQITSGSPHSSAAIMTKNKQPYWGEAIPGWLPSIGREIGIVSFCLADLLP